MAMQVALTSGEQARVIEKGAKNLGAYLKMLEASAQLNVGTRESVALARQAMEESLALDPHYASAQVVLAHVNIMEVFLGASKSRAESLDRAEELTRKVISSDESHWYAHTILSMTYAFKRQYDKALPEAEKAVALSPSSALAVFMLGSALAHSERFEEAIPYIKKSLRLSPIEGIQHLVSLGNVYWFLGRYDEAIEIYEKALKLQPDYVPAHVALAAAYASAGRVGEARSQAAEVMRIDPQFSLETYAKHHALRKELVDQRVEALSKAGLK